MRPRILAVLTLVIAAVLGSCTLEVDNLDGREKAAQCVEGMLTAAGSTEHPNPDSESVYALIDFCERLYLTDEPDLREQVQEGE